MLYNFSFLLLFLCSFLTIQGGGSIIGVEFKSGKEDQGVDYFEDMSLGVNANDLIRRFKELGVNNIRIPIMTKIYPDQRADIIVDFLRKLNDEGTDVKVILSVRKWSLHKEKQWQSWSRDTAYVYNAIQAAGLESMIMGCSFDENGNLRDQQSSKILWDHRHNGILIALKDLNKKTNGAFKSRTVFIHGKGMGAQFKGVYLSSKATQFNEKMMSLCKAYSYNFKFFQTGFPEDISVTGWKDWLNTYCALDEVKKLGVPLMFVGDSGDGIRGGAFEVNTKVYGKCGPNVMVALKELFAENNWRDFSFGVFVTSPKKLGKTSLHKIPSTGRLISLKEQLDCWMVWRQTMLQDMQN